MEDLENWLRGILRQKETDEESWFLSRPALRAARQRDVPELQGQLSGT